jgi:hypothetical protein
MEATPFVPMSFINAFASIKTISPGKKLLSFKQIKSIKKRE